MKSLYLRLSLLISVLGALSLNVALADDTASLEFKTGGIVVSYNDLNGTNSAGLESLLRRVESAAHKVCGTETFKVSLDIVRKNQDCVSMSVDLAMLQIGDDMITALVQSKTVIAP